jgi:asparagine synthase (glutamine-hydrolysing)
MVADLARRGPDSEGIAVWPGVALGHRRLAILDLSDAGHQPMLSEDGQIGVVFNGCIYNYVPLREELIQRGHLFRSHCDTEVLLRGYQEWGIDGLSRRINGMFAFGIWDHSRRKLFLVRDRLGVKPLVYASIGSDIAFASTISALRAGGVGGEIDPEAILEFLEFGFVTEARCIYTGIQKLPPASILEWHDGSCSTRTYWSLPEIDAFSSLTFDEAVEQTEQLIIDAVRLRVQSDVPVGALLSGGIDSALVCWALAKINTNITTFTIATPGDPADESADAAFTAGILGIPNKQVSLDLGQTGYMEQLVDAFSEPFACQSAAGMLRVSAAVRPFAKVLLTGDGGDEIFGGYSFLSHAWRAEQISRILPASAVPVWRTLRRAIPSVGPLRRARNFGDYVVGGLGSFSRIRPGLPFFEERNLLGDRLAQTELPQRNVPPSTESARRLFSDVFAYHKKTHFQSEFLLKVDGATMYHGIEARAPFLDQHIWEFAAQLPPEIRFRGGQLKAILRRIVRNRIHPAVATRRKRGFNVPAEEWLYANSKRYLDPLRRGSLLEHTGWINPGKLNTAINDALRLGSIPTQLWYLVVLEEWLQRERFSARRAVRPGLRAVPFEQIAI